MNFKKLKYIVSINIFVFELMKIKFCFRFLILAAEIVAAKENIAAEMSMAARLRQVLEKVIVAAARRRQFYKPSRRGSGAVTFFISHRVAAAVR
jgi:hypothetical protein